MLFQNGVFTPDGSADHRVQAALRSAVGLRKDVLGPADLLAGVIRCGDPGVGEILSQALRPGVSLFDLLGVVENGHAAGNGQLPVRTRDSFTPAALAALDEFESTLAEAGGHM